MAKLTTAERLVFLDVLRLIAAVQMIQGHSVAALLAPEYRDGPGYSMWTFARGLTSVLFLTTAGLAFVLAEARANDGPARRRRSLRALRLLIIGYAMHAPYFVLLGSAPLRPLSSALVVDVLHCIGLSLLGLELLTMALARASLRVAAGLALALVCFACAPAAQSLAFDGLELLLGNYLTARYGSLFPLLPWAGYVFAGFALGTLAFRSREAALPTHDSRRASHEWWLAGAGAASLVLGLLLMRFAAALPLGVSPGYAAVKLGCVLLLGGALARAFRGVTRLPGLLSRLASETLFLYVSHVVILYADGVGLEARLRDRHGPLVGVAFALLLLLTCGAAALGFRRLVRSLRAAGRGSTRSAQLP